MTVNAPAGAVCSTTTSKKEEDGGFVSYFHVVIN